MLSSLCMGPATTSTSVESREIAAADTAEQSTVGCRAVLGEMKPTLEKAAHVGHAHANSHSVCSESDRVRPSSRSFMRCATTLSRAIRFNLGSRPS